MLEQTSIEFQRLRREKYVVVDFYHPEETVEALEPWFAAISTEDWSNCFHNWFD